MADENKSQAQLYAESHDLSTVSDMSYDEAAAKVTDPGVQATPAEYKVVDVAPRPDNDDLDIGIRTDPGVIIPAKVEYNAPLYVLEAQAAAAQAGETNWSDNPYNDRTEAETNARVERGAAAEEESKDEE